MAWRKHGPINVMKSLHSQFQKPLELTKNPNTGRSDDSGMVKGHERRASTLEPRGRESRRNGTVGSAESRTAVRWCAQCMNHSSCRVVHSPAKQLTRDGMIDCSSNPNMTNRSWFATLNQNHAQNDLVFWAVAQKKWSFYSKIIEIDQSGTKRSVIFEQ